MEGENMAKRYYVGSVSREGLLELCYDDEYGITHDYELQSPDLKDSRDTFVLAADHDNLAKAALDLIDEADLTCHRKNEEIAVGECPCAVCVLQGLASSGGEKHGDH
jgi:hypothetical protein